MSLHWLPCANRVPSPNCNERPAAAEISLLVIHNISLPPKQYGSKSVQKFFLNQLDRSAHPYFQEIANLQVSSHLYIERDGDLTQFVALDMRAWHAGRSCFDGAENCNDFSIGIELEGCDEEPYTQAQYQRLVEVSALIMNTYPLITLDRIVGHSDIAPGRKTDPGAAFDWRRYREALVQHLVGVR